MGRKRIRRASVDLRLLHPTIKTTVALNSIEEYEAELIWQHRLPFGTTALCNGERQLVEDGLITLRTPPGTVVVRVAKEDESWSALRPLYFGFYDILWFSFEFESFYVKVTRWTLYKDVEVQLEHEELDKMKTHELKKMLQEVRRSSLISFLCRTLCFT